MKDISREINRYLMDIDEACDKRHEFLIINELQEFIDLKKYTATHNNKDESYYTLACNEMFNDIARYLDRYRSNNNLPYKECYSIRTVPHSSKSMKMRINIKQNKPIRIQYLKNAINTFPNYTIFIILGLDSTLGEEYIKFNRNLIKEEYDRFLEIRDNDPEYFVPFIQHILHEMNNLKSLKE